MNKQKGVTIIELMIVVIIIGILATLSMTTYQNYTVRARVSEVIGVFAKDKSMMSEYYISQGTLIGSETSLNTSKAQSLYLDAVTVLNVTHYTITVEYTIDPIIVGVPLDQNTIIVEGKATMNGVRWVCNLGTLDVKYLPKACQ